MINIEWLISGVRPEWVEQNYQDGGYVYDTYARTILRDVYNLKVTYFPRGNSPSKAKRFSEFLSFLRNCRKIKFQGDVVFRDVYSTAFAPFDRERKHIVILHHLDRKSFRYKSFSRLFVKRFFENVLQADRVVVVSEYWKNILELQGCTDVAVIYNSFDPSMFGFDRRDLAGFQKKLPVTNGKPVIYLGNARPEKGFRESFQSLKELDAVFVTTGKKRTELPILNFYLSYPDYLKLLTVSTLVCTMSTFDEGWCRTAHEAMLCGTPVIGSGRGGMQELLEKGSQIVCSDFSHLKKTVKNLLEDKDKLEDMASSGRKFASQYSLDYFKDSFLNLIKEVTQ